MLKFNRNYLLTVEGSDGQDVIIKPPFTVEFSVQRNFLSTANNSSVRIYNLSETNRANLRKDVQDANILREFSFQAGYDDKLSMLAVGQVNEGFSTREGTEYITTIETFDGGYAFRNAFSSVQWPSGTPYLTIILALIDSLSSMNISRGSIGTITGSCSRTFAVSGSTIDILRELTGGTFFIDNGFAHVLSNKEYIAGNILKISKESGLLGTPKRRKTYIDLSMIFEPSVYIGQLVNLFSPTGVNLDGDYIVSDIKHHGIISPSISGQAVTDLTLINERGIITPVTTI